MFDSEINCIIAEIVKSHVLPLLTGINAFAYGFTCKALYSFFRMNMMKMLKKDLCEGVSQFYTASSKTRYHLIDDVIWIEGNNRLHRWDCYWSTKRVEELAINGYWDLLEWMIMNFGVNNRVDSFEIMLSFGAPISIIKYMMTYHSDNYQLSIGGVVSCRNYTPEDALFLYETLAHGFELLRFIECTRQYGIVAILLRRKAENNTSDLKDLYGWESSNYVGIILYFTAFVGNTRSLSYVEKLLGTNIRRSALAIKGAIEGSNQETLTWLCEKGYAYDQDCINDAIRVGNPEIFKIVTDLDDEYNLSIDRDEFAGGDAAFARMVNVCIYGRLIAHDFGSVDLFLEIYYTFGTTISFHKLNEALSDDRSELAEVYVKSGALISHEECAMVLVDHRRLDLLKELRDRYVFEWPNNLFTYAIIHGSLEIVEWLLEVGCPTDHWAYNIVRPNYRMKCEELAILELLHSKNIISDNPLIIRHWRCPAAVKRLAKLGYSINDGQTHLLCFGMVDLRCRHVNCGH